MIINLLFLKGCVELLYYVINQKNSHEETETERSYGFKWSWLLREKLILLEIIFFGGQPLSGKQSHEETLNEGLYGRLRI